jgi:hypothetical protein
MRIKKNMKKVFFAILITIFPSNCSENYDEMVMDTKNNIIQKQ